MDDLFPTHIRRLILTNHKCFYEPTEFEFGPGFNILVGENSSGKSTVLEALDPASQPSHHHSLRNEISEGVVKPGPSIVELHYAITAHATTKLTQLNRIYVGNRHPDSGQVVGLSVERWYEQIHFLARPMLEDYLLHPGAICSLIHDRAGVVVTTDEIATKLEAAKSKTECWLKPNAKSSEIHAAKVLKLVCHELTDGKFEYGKNRDGPYLVEHLLKYDAEALSESRALLLKVLTGK